MEELRYCHEPLLQQCKRLQRKRHTQSGSKADAAESPCTPPELSAGVPKYQLAMSVCGITEFPGSNLKLFRQHQLHDHVHSQILVRNLQTPIRGEVRTMLSDLSPVPSEDLVEAHLAHCTQ